MCDHLRAVRWRPCGAYAAELSGSVGSTEVAANFAAIGANTFLIPVDFDAIADADCRRRFHSISTSWALPSRQVDALMAVGQALLGVAPKFEPMMKSLGVRLGTPLPTVPDACRALAGPTN